MKRVLAPLLVGIGVFLLALAVLLPTVVVPRVEKAPLDAYSVTEATGSGTFFDASSVQFRDDDALKVTQVVRGDVESGSDDVAVYDFSQTLESEQVDEPVNVTTERIFLDRSTGEGVGGRGDRPSHEGAHTVKLPFNTEKGEFPYHDTTARSAFPVTFSQEVEVDGATLYEFTGSVPEIRRDSLSVPGDLIGSDAPSVFVEEYYTNERAILVEPRTGSIVSTTNNPRRVWRPADIGTQDSGSETVIFEAEIQATEETVSERLDEALDAKSSLDLLGRTLPILLGLLGVLALFAGIGLLLRGDRARHRDDDDRDGDRDDDRDDDDRDDDDVAYADR